MRKGFPLKRGWRSTKGTSIKRDHLFLGKSSRRRKKTRKTKFVGFGIRDQKKGKSIRRRPQEKAGDSLGKGRSRAPPYVSQAD